jgi:exopolysaccharide biosynthesis predicted pyruvyltransferase EpsI
MSSSATTARLPLLPLAAFAEISAVLSGRRIWFATGQGNVGDALIHAGTHCLWRKIGTEVVDRTVRPDFLVWGGGGNIGTLWPASFAKRQREFAGAMAAGIPIVVLPQSATNAEEPMPAKALFFARERATQALYVDSKLAPDLALAFDDDVSAYADAAPSLGLGIFLRSDAESTGKVDRNLSLADPPKIARAYLDYFRIASDFTAIVTDRLHFAIAALILGRITVLLPNSYYKNAGVYTEWLERLGCGWGPEAMDALINEYGYNPQRAREDYESRHHARID